MDNNIEIDFLVGVSAGIANGISFISKQRGRGLELGLNFVNDKRYMGAKYYFKKDNRSYYNIDFVFKDIPKTHLPFDYDTFSSFKGDVYAVVTNIADGKSEYIKVDDYNDSWKVILASCSLPIMFRPVELNGNFYMDGGCSDPLPVRFAYESGCDKVITVLTRERTYSKDKGIESNFSSLLFKNNPCFANVLKNRDVIYNESKRFVFEKEKEGSAFVFAPKSTQGWKRNEKRSYMLQMMYDEGYNDAIGRMNDLKDFINKK